MTPTPSVLAALSLALLALGLLLGAVLMVASEWRAVRAQRVLGRAIEDGMTAPVRTAERAVAPDEALPPVRAEAELPAHWLQTRWGRLLVADEDRRLIDQCGWPSVPAQLTLLVVRIALAISLPALAWGMLQAGWLPKRPTVVLAIALLLGFMLPKWLLARQAAVRRARVAHELPLFVDLLRLLQGVGMSLDQGLQIMADDFKAPLRVLCRELDIANRQYKQGRDTRAFAAAAGHAAPERTPGRARRAARAGRPAWRRRAGTAGALQRAPA